MFALAALNPNIRPWNTVRPMSEASQAAKDTESGLARCKSYLLADLAPQCRLIMLTSLDPQDRFVLEV